MVTRYLDFLLSENILFSQTFILTAQFRGVRKILLFPGILSITIISGECFCAGIIRTTEDSLKF